MSFQHQPLPTKTHLRLLTILPGQSGQIRITLHVEDERSNPDYQCLSYTWDGPRADDIDESWLKPQFTININGFEFFIQRNLHDAMLHLRTLGILGPLWIDALSINQTDESEKNIQVARMNHIYGNAAGVVAWLGTEDDRTITILKTLEKIGMTDEDVMSQNALEKVHKSLTEGLFDDTDLTDILELSLRFNWFTRIWIVQEMVLASSLRFICGTSIIGFATICAAELLIVIARGFFNGKKMSFLTGYLEGLQKPRSESVAKALVISETELMSDSAEVSKSAPNILEKLTQSVGMGFLKQVSSRMQSSRDLHFDLAGRMTFSAFGGLSTILQLGFRPQMGATVGDTYPLSFLAQELRVKKAKDPRDKLYGILGMSRKVPRSRNVIEN